VIDYNVGTQLRQAAFFPLASLKAIPAVESNVVGGGEEKILN
jgi:hypothetical protein